MNNKDRLIGKLIEYSTILEKKSTHSPDANEIQLKNKIASLRKEVKQRERIAYIKSEL